MRVRTTFLLVLLVGGASAREASAREWEVSGGAAVHYLNSPGLDAAASSDEVTFGELAAGVEVLRDLPWLDRVVAEARWQGGSTAANDFELYQAAFDLDTFALGLRGVREVYSHVRVYAHADLGGARGRFAIGSGRSAGSELEDVDWTWAANLGGGLDLALYQQGAEDPHPDFALGVRLELGYQATGTMAFVARPMSFGAGAPLETVATPLGDLDADGGVFRIGVFGRW